MTLSREEALETLRAVADTEQRSIDLARYRRSAPFFYWWGLYWIMCYGATALWPWKAGWIWPIGSAIGIAGHIAIAHRTGQRQGDWRWIAGYLILFAFAAATFAMMQPIDGLKIGAFLPLMMGAIYGIAGLLFGQRLVITGLVVMAAALAGFFFLREIFCWWMAAVGGGALILTGIWLQKA